MALATNNRKTADAAAKAYGVSRAYDNGSAMVQAPDIDVVTVATRVPAHRELVLAALAAGKHVYSEWPLGRSTAEAKEMDAAAHAANKHVVIGLQLRASPTVRRA